jgi:hypothetical protein
MSLTTNRGNALHTLEFSSVDEVNWAAHAVVLPSVAPVLRVETDLILVDEARLLLNLERLDCTVNPSPLSMLRLTRTIVTTTTVKPQ